MSCFNVSTLQTRLKVKPHKGRFLMEMKVNWFHSVDLRYHVNATSAVMNVQWCRRPFADFSVWLTIILQWRCNCVGENSSQADQFFVLQFVSVIWSVGLIRPRSSAALKLRPWSPGGDGCSARCGWGRRSCTKWRRSRWTGGSLLFLLTLHRSAVVRIELSQKAKLLIYQSLYVPPPPVVASCG